MAQVYHHPNGYEGYNAVDVVAMCNVCHGKAHSVKTDVIPTAPRLRRYRYIDWEARRQRRNIRLRKLDAELRKLREQYRKRT